MTDVLARLRAMQADDVPGHGRPHAGLRLRLRARGGRPGRARGGGGVRRLQRARPDRLPEPADDGERARRVRGDAARRPDDDRRHGDQRRHRVGAPGGAGCPRLRARTIERPRMVLPVTAHAAFHKAAHYFGVEAVMVDVDEEFRARPDAMEAAIDERTVLVVASAPSYAHGVVDPVTEIAGGRRCARSPLPRRRLHRRLGAAVRRPARSPGPAVDLRRRGRHQHLGRPAQVRLRPQGHLDPAAPHARRCAGRSSSRARGGRATRCSTRRCSRRSRAVRSRGRGRWSNTIGDEGYLDADREGARRRRPAGRGDLDGSRGCGSSYVLTRRWSRSPPTTPATSSRSPTR